MRSGDCMIVSSRRVTNGAGSVDGGVCDEMHAASKVGGMIRNVGGEVVNN